jgi:hypothetical protein
MKPLILATVLALGLPQALAQAYRCQLGGRIVFQQAPCDGGNQVAKPGAAPAAEASLTGAALCERHARQPGVFNDPPSLRFGATRYVGARKFMIHDTTIAARTYALTINARNAYGGYDGDAVFECQLSEDEARVLKFAPAQPYQPPASAR